MWYVWTYDVLLSVFGYQEKLKRDKDIRKSVERDKW